MAFLSRTTAHLQRVHAHNLHTLRTSPISELSGALGDLGTLLPLTLALTLTSSISLPSTLVVSGLSNILTGAAFGIPLPVQPMKAIASIAISSQFSKAETASAGLAVGAAVLLLCVTGTLSWLARVVPVPVVRGIQVGAGLSLVSSAGASLLQPLHWTGPSWSDSHVWTLAAAVGLLLATVRPRVPFALIVTLLGLVLAAVVTAQRDDGVDAETPWLWHPRLLVPSPKAFYRGALEAGLPQLPLTTLNSILAVASLAASMSPPLISLGSSLSNKRLAPTTALGLSVAVTNLIGPWFAAMPVCHGSGGLAAQYRFGARSGASVIVLGLVKLLLGLFVGERIVPLLRAFPHSLLGVMVVAAGIELAKVGRDLSDKDALGEQDGQGERLAMSDDELAERWIVMLVTVAGCLALKNDAVGFAAGMLWHWGFSLSKNGFSIRDCLGRRRRSDGETRPLLCHEQ